MSPDDLPPGAVLAAALTREHHDIDAALERFGAELAEGTVRPQPLASAVTALRRHIYLEEELLFPPIAAAGLDMPIRVMLLEHARIWRVLDRLEHDLDDLLVDGVTPASIHDGLLAECRELLALLASHNHKEEPIVYPRAELDLTPEACERLLAFLDGGRTPEGWVCLAVAHRRDAAPGAPVGDG